MASIRKQGNAWQAIIRKKGHKTVSQFFPKKILAQSWARKKEEEISKNVHLSGLAQTTTVAEIMEKYHHHITPRKKSAHIEKYRIATVINHLGGYTLEHLTPSVIIDFVDTRLKEVSGDSVRKEIGVLSLAIDASMALWGIELPANPVSVARNVLKVTKTLGRGNRRERRPTNSELALLYENLSGLMPQLIEFAIETGMRRGEIVNMKWSHIDGVTLHIPQTKTGKPRTIPLSARAREILAALPQGDNDYVWSYAAESISHAFIRMCKKLEIEDLRFHDLRHEAASRFFERGLNVAEVAKITGQTFATLQRYTHLKAEDIAEKLG